MNWAFKMGVVMSTGRRKTKLKKKSALHAKISQF